MLIINEVDIVICAVTFLPFTVICFVFREQSFSEKKKTFFIVLNKYFIRRMFVVISVTNQMNFEKLVTIPLEHLTWCIAEMGRLEFLKVNQQ